MCGKSRPKSTILFFCSSSNLFVFQAKYIPAQPKRGPHGALRSKSRKVFDRAGEKAEEDEGYEVFVSTFKCTLTLFSISCVIFTEQYGCATSDPKSSGEITGAIRDAIPKWKD